MSFITTGDGRRPLLAPLLRSGRCREYSLPRRFRDTFDPGLRVAEQIVPLGPGLQKFLQGVVVFASQADVGSKIDDRCWQHEVAEIWVAVLRDKRPENSSN